MFFTLCLAERGSDLLLRKIDALRDAVRRTRAERPFGVDAWVVMPDHVHWLFQLTDSATLSSVVKVVSPGSVLSGGAPE